MKFTEHVAKSVSISMTGIFATLRGLLHISGTGASRITQGSGAPSRLILWSLTTAFGVLAFTAVPAVAAAPETPETLAAGPVAVSSATLNGVLNPGTLLEPPQSGTYEFLYKASATECAGGNTAPDPAGMALGVGPEPESQPLTGLLPGTVYTFCLLARNTALETTVGPAVTFTTRGPGISEEQVTNVEATTATLQASINPNESKTTYHFEYDTTPYTSSAAHGASTTTQEIPPGASPVIVSAQLKGLQPGTTYYYRVVAESEPTGVPETFDGPGKALTTNALPSLESEGCSNEQVRTEQPYGLRLPDCRAYELVSPVNKADNDIGSTDSRASVSGEALAYVSPGSFAEPKSALLNGTYIARRERDGWSNENISPPFKSFETATGHPFEELLFTPDLSRGIVSSEFTPLVEGEPAGYTNLYVADLEKGAYQTVTLSHSPAEEPYESLEKSRVFSAGVSADLSHVVFQEGGNPNGGSPRDHVYEWADGVLDQVDVPPAGGTLEAEDGVGALGWEGAPVRGDTWHAVSADGSRVYFTGGEGKGEEYEGQLYVRENPMSAMEGCGVAGDACTVEVSASQRTNAQGEPELDPNDHTVTTRGQAGLRPARYWDASADGSRVFFTSRAELTDNANTGTADNAENLYEYNLENGVLTDLTPENAEGAKVLGLVAASEDGSYVYFVAEGALTSKANIERQNAEPSKPNLYIYHGGAVTFIATLAPANGGGLQFETGGDATDWYGERQEHTIDPIGNVGPENHSVRVSAGGSRLVFMSAASLTGYDNAQAAPGECEGELEGRGFETGTCREVYLYDAVTNALECVSCDHSGARPVGPAELGGQEVDPNIKNVIPSPFYVTRNLSENGDRLFFESPDALVPQDSNGLLDVYEWESEGEGGCVEPGGCVRAISNVAGSYASRFMDASPSGNDVFIATKDQLVATADGDSRVNAYDVRVDGGFPEPSVPPTCSNADSCKPPVSPQPTIFGAPSSATFSGPGNPSPPPPVYSPLPPKKTTTKTVKCKKSRVRKHNKCVRRKKTKVKKSAHTNRRARS